MSILLWNCNSIRNKTHLLESIIDTNQPHIICLTETHLHEEITDGEIFPPSYTTFRKDRNTHGGGVLIAIANNNEDIKLLRTHGTLSHTDEMMAIRLSMWGLEADIVCYYRPPTQSHVNGLKTYLEEEAGPNTIVCGDFNLPGINWSTKALTEPRKGPTGLQQDFLNMITSHGLHQIIDIPTHRLGSTLDLVLSSLDEDPALTHTDTGLSDHAALTFTISIAGHQKHQPAPATPKVFYDFNRINPQLFNELELIHTQIVSDLAAGKSPNSSWTYFRDSATQAMNNNIKTKSFTKQPKPWITRDTIKEIRKRRRMFKYWCKEKNTASRTLLNTQDKLCKRLVGKDYQDHLNKRIGSELEKGNSKPLFAFLKQRKGATEAIMKLEGCNPGDNYGMAESFAAAFASVFTKETVEEK